MGVITLSMVLTAAMLGQLVQDAIIQSNDRKAQQRLEQNRKTIDKKITELTQQYNQGMLENSKLINELVRLTGLDAERANRARQYIGNSVSTLVNRQLKDYVNEVDIKNQEREKTVNKLQERNQMLQNELANDVNKLQERYNEKDIVLTNL